MRVSAFVRSLTTLATCFTGLFRRELVGISAFVRSLAALTGDLTLALRVHCSKAALGTAFSTALVTATLVCLIACSHMCLLFR